MEAKKKQKSDGEKVCEEAQRNQVAKQGGR